MLSYIGTLSLSSSVQPMPESVLWQCLSYGTATTLLDNYIYIPFLSLLFFPAQAESTHRQNLVQTLNHRTVFQVPSKSAILSFASLPATRCSRCSRCSSVSAVAVLPVAAVAAQQSLKAATLPTLKKPKTKLTNSS